MTLRILSVEDNEDDANLCRLALSEYGIEFEMLRVEEEDPFREALQGVVDIILCDHSLPRFSAPRALKIIKELELDIPFIVVSGTIGEDIAVEMMRDGAHDYLLKHQLARLGPAVLRELKEAQLRQARQRSEHEIRILLHITKAASVADHFNHVLQEALYAICTELHWDYGEAWFPDERKQSLVHSLIWWAEQDNFSALYEEVANMPDTLWEELSVWAWDTDKSHYALELHTPPLSFFNRPASAQRLGLRTGMVLPVFSNKARLITVLCFYSSQIKTKDKHVNRTLSAAIDQLSSAFQHIRATEALRENEALLSSLANHIPGVIYRFKRDDDGRYALPYISRAVQDLFGHSQDEATRDVTLLFNCIYEEDRAHIMQLIETSAAQGTPWDMEMRILRKDGSLRWVHGRARPRPRLHDGGIIWDGVFLDITDRKLAQQKLEFLTYHDHTTGMANQQLLLEHASQAIKTARHLREMVAIITFAVDQHDTVVQSMGLQEGEQLIREVAARSHTLAGELYTAARLGSNQFALLMPGLRDLDEALNQITSLMEAFSVPVNLGNQDITLSISIGAALFPQDAENAESLLRDASTALTRVQSSGGNAYQFYTADMNSLAKARLSIEARMHQALLKPQFELVFQPQTSLNDSDTVIGVEALVRWQDADGKQISPLDFIPLAEETGMIVPIGQWVLETACQTAKEWHDQGLSITMSVNLSPRQLRQSDIKDMIAGVITRTGIPPELLKLEITESAVMHDIENSLAIMHELRELGVKFTIDDFGTGYSSLNYLARLPVDSLKVDRSFVAEMTRDRRSARIVESIINLAHALDLYVVAEGIETQDQLAFLRAYGCDAAQGFLFYQPMAPMNTHSILQSTRITPLHSPHQIM